MSDRFKFRVFGLCCNSKLEKYWVDITNVGSFSIDKNGKLLDESAYFDPINYPENFVIEQCTGLKDKNGNLIYEGDIIKDRGEIKYQIKWKDASFFTVAMNEFNYMPDCILVQQWLKTWKAEIIGNVHTGENK